MSTPTYCPLKLMASAKDNPFKSGITGAFLAENKCDQSMCGFWSTAANMCGLAALGALAALNTPSETETEKEIDA
jgi:hypothetical protein